MLDIKIKLLGNFDIIVNGESIISSLGNSNKSLMLIKYLIVKNGKYVSFPELIDTFWQESDKSSNPENALKTMISRIRKSLSSIDVRLSNCICSDKGSYYWNKDINCEVDIVEFENLCSKLDSSVQLNDETEKQFIAAINMYGGDMSYSSSDEDWLVGRSLYLHRMYIKMAMRYIRLLKQKGDYDSSIHVCRTVLDIDLFDEDINLELINALKQSGQNHAALVQYQYITNAYYKYLGVEPSERIQSFYKNLIKADLSSKSDITSIKNSLINTNKNINGAFLCDFSIFKDIYCLQMRNIERNFNKLFLSLITIKSSSGTSFEPLVLDSMMNFLLKTLESLLRKGDTISRYSTSQYAILLPMLSYSNGEIITQRIKRIFYKKYSDSKAKLIFQYVNLADNSDN